MSRKPRLVLAEFSRQSFTVDVEADVTNDELLSPDYWSDYATGLQPGDHIEVRRGRDLIELRVVERQGDGVVVAPIVGELPSDEPEERDTLIVGRASHSTPHEYTRYRRIHGGPFQAAWNGGTHLESIVRETLELLDKTPSGWPNLMITNRVGYELQNYPFIEPPYPGGGLWTFGGGLTLYARGADPNQPDIWNQCSVHGPEPCAPQNRLHWRTIADHILTWHFQDGPDKTFGREPCWKEWQSPHDRPMSILIRPDWNWSEIAPRPAKPVEDGEDPGEWNPFADRPWTSAELEYADMRTPEYQRALKAREINKKGKKRKAEQARIQQQQGRVFDTKRRSWYAPE